LADTSDQRKKELEWLSGDTEASLLSKKLRPTARLIDIAKRLKRIIKNHALDATLDLLDEHNRDQERIKNEEQSRNKSSLLLSPYLFHVMKTVEDRWDVFAKMPALDRPAGEVRDHFDEASTKCKELADLLRRGPALFVALAEHRDGWEEVFESLGSSFLQSPDKSPAIVTFDRLLDHAASSHARLARRVARAKHHRRPAKKKAEAKNEELRSLIAREIEGIFRSFLGKPYYAQVAVVATLLSGLETDPGYVKKIAERSRKGRAARDKVSRNRS
jgi:hypothetical protein